VAGAWANDGVSPRSFKIKITVQIYLGKKTIRVVDTVAIQPPAYLVRDAPRRIK
jgi:hypothetical protein